MKRSLSLLSIIALFVSLINPLHGQTDNSTIIIDMITVYQADYGALSRKYAVQPSVEHFDRFDSFFSNWLKQLNGISFEDLDQSQKVDFTLFKNDLTRSQYFLKVVSSFEKCLFTTIKLSLRIHDSYFLLL